MVGGPGRFLYMAGELKGADSQPTALESSSSMPAPGGRQSTRIASRSVSAESGAGWEVGHRVEVEWEGAQWRASVVGVETGGAVCVHYDGDDDSAWDEKISPSSGRLNAPSETFDDDDSDEESEEDTAGPSPIPAKGVRKVRSALSDRRAALFKVRTGA